MTATPISLFTYVNSPRKELQNKAKKQRRVSKKKKEASSSKCGESRSKSHLVKAFRFPTSKNVFAPPPLLRTVWCLSGSDKAAFWAVLFLGTHLSLIVEDLMVSENTKKGKKQNCKPIMCAVGEKWHSGAALYVIYICAIPRCQLPICFFMAFCHSFSSACTLIPAGQTQRLHPSFFCHRLPCTQGCYDQPQLSWGQGRVEPWTSLWTGHAMF